MEGDALTQALALQQSPLLRFSLRGSPLPPGILTVLQLAAARQPLLEDTAGRVELDQADLLEAARFYLQQVLFEGEPDAYRILAATPETPLQDIRTNLRWLQRWLHPDRRHEHDWESLFSSRVNWAWSQLRSESARSQYDEQRRESQALAVQPQAPPIGQGRWQPVPVIESTEPRHVLRRASLGAMAFLCLGLLLLALVREDRAHLRAPIASAPEYEAPASIAPPPRPPAEANSAHFQAQATLPPRESAAPERPAVSPQAPAAPTALRQEPIRTVQTLAARRTESTASVPEPAPKAVAPRVAKSAPASPSAPRRSLEQESPRPALRHPPLPAPQATAEAHERATIPLLPPSAATAEVTFPKQAAPLTASLTSAATARPSSRPMPDGRSPAPAADSVDMLTRMERARGRVDALVEYFRQPYTDPPAWPDATAPYSAQASRAALRERADPAQIAGFELESPYWQMSDDKVQLQAAYRIGSGHGSGERGLLRVGMVWTNESWRLTRVELEPFQ